MKRINILLLAMMGMIALTWTSCNDSIEYTPAGPENGAYFSNNDPTTITLDGTSGIFSVTVYRTSTDETGEAAVQAEVSEGAAGLFTVPSSVSFAEGAESATLNINFNNVVRGTRYQITLTLGTGTPYGNATQTFTVSYPEEVEVWDVVSTEAILIDNMFSAFGVTNLQITGITVEKNPNANQYRFRSPYDNDYFASLFGAGIYPDDYETPYIILDGEAYAEADPGSYYIASSALGFQMVNGEGPQMDESWNTFGSIAGNLATGDGPITPPNSQYPLGTYNEATKMFDLGAVYHNIGSYGYFTMNAGSFELYLDPALMTVDYDRDYTWYDVYNAAGTFSSKLSGDHEWQQPVQRSVEDPTFYRFPSLYAQGVHIYFNYDAEAGTLTMPRMQPTGLTTNIGNQAIYVSGVLGGLSIDAENPNLLHLNLSFTLADEDGNTTAELTQAAETFAWGQGVYDNFTKNATMDDYVGSWTTTMTDGESTMSVPVTVTKVKDEEGGEHLLASGLSGVDVEGFNDTVELLYDEESGYALFVFQGSGAFPADTDDEGNTVYYASYAAPYYSQTGAPDLSGEDVLVGGLTENGELRFADNLTNSSLYDGIIFMVTPDGSQLYLLSGYWAGLAWVAETTTAFQQLVPLKSMKTVSTQKTTVSRRTYETTLNVQSGTRTCSKQVNVPMQGKQFFEVEK